MCIVESGRDLGGYCRRRLRRERAVATDSIAQGSAREIRHDEEDVIVYHSEVDDLATVRVHQLRRRCRLATESLTHLVLARQVRVKHFDHDRRVETHIEGVVDARHATLTHAMHDRVTTAGDLTECCHRWIWRSLSLIGVFGH